MKPALIISLIVASVNIIPGILLILFHKPLGTWAKKWGEILCENPILSIFLFKALHVGKRYQIFLLILGVWLILWGCLFGGITFTIINKQEKENNYNESSQVTCFPLSLQASTCS